MVDHCDGKVLICDQKLNVWRIMTEAG